MKAATVVLSRSKGDSNIEWRMLIEETGEAVRTSFIDASLTEFIVGMNPIGMVWVITRINEYFDFSVLDDKLFAIGEIKGTGIWMVIDGEGYYA